MKKLISLTLAMILTLALLGASFGAAAESDVKKSGTLSYLNLTEEEDSDLAAMRGTLMRFLALHGVLKADDGWFQGPVSVTLHFYDTLDALLMALQAGEISSVKVPYTTAQYLCATNDNLRMTVAYDAEKNTPITSRALGMISDGYSFMLKEDNAKLRDAFDAQITAMKEDGTLQKLIDEHITKVAQGGEPVSVVFGKFEGDPIRIAVTGSLPPMDYVAADGTFAGFNTAVLAEIGNRLQKNIELVQVDSIGRAMALSEGTVDVVFWTRGMSELMMKNRQELEGMSEEELKEQDAQLTDEEKFIIAPENRPDKETEQKIDNRDMPEGTIITAPYFSDQPAWVVLK